MENNLKLKLKELELLKHLEVLYKNKLENLASEYNQEKHKLNIMIKNNDNKNKLSLIYIIPFFITLFSLPFGLPVNIIRLLYSLVLSIITLSSFGLYKILLYKRNKRNKAKIINQQEVVNNKYLFVKKQARKVNKVRKLIREDKKEIEDIRKLLISKFCIVIEKRLEDDLDYKRVLK